MKGTAALLKQTDACDKPKEQILSPEMTAKKRNAGQEWVGKKAAYYQDQSGQCIFRTQPRQYYKYRHCQKRENNPGWHYDGDQAKKYTQKGGACDNERGRSISRPSSAGNSPEHNW